MPGGFIRTLHFPLLAQCFDDRVRLGELAGLQLGINLRPVDGDFKSAAARRNEFERTDLVFELQ
jgi:hypothetical protein